MMADPLSITASVIAVATLAWQSSKTTYEIIDKITGAPDAITHSRSVLLQTQSTLESLKETLLMGNNSGAFDAVLQKINIRVALELTQRLCDRFTKVIRGVTSRSIDSKFSKRDRLAVSFRESSITNFNRQLGDCQRTISIVLTSITLYDPHWQAGSVQMAHLT